MELFRTVMLAVVLLVVLLTGACSISCVPTGHAGVVTTFGAVTGRQLDEGLNVVAPWQGVHELSIRTQEVKEHADTPSSEGLIIGLEASLLFRLDRARATNVYQTIGANYVDVVVTPNLRSAMRTATAKHKAEALYGEAREGVATEIRAAMEAQVAPRGIVVENVLLRDVKLPGTLTAAIESKQGMEQESLRMQFVLSKERQEAERKTIEAKGIKDFQDIVTQGISDKLLQWKGIEATNALTHSPNAKVVIIGGGKDGLPIIFSAGQ